MGDDYIHRKFGKRQSIWGCHKQEASFIVNAGQGVHVINRVVKVSKRLYTSFKGAAGAVLAHNHRAGKRSKCAVKAQPLTPLKAKPLSIR
jgi:hypothetical protein